MSSSATSGTGGDGWSGASRYRLEFTFPIRGRAGTGVVFTQFV